MSRRPRTAHKLRRFLVWVRTAHVYSNAMLVESKKRSRVRFVIPRRSKRLEKVAQNSQAKMQKAERPPQISVASQGEQNSPRNSKPRQKKVNRAARQKSIYRAIDEYRHRVMEKANQECNAYRAAMIREEEEEKRNTTISFNRKKEVLEFCKNILREAKPKRQSVEPEVKPYEIKSVLKGSTEVYIGKVSSKRNSILGDYHINEETVQELRSEELSEVKPLEVLPEVPPEVPVPPPQKSPRGSPKTTPKSSVEKKKDKSAK